MILLSPLVISLCDLSCRIMALNAKVGITIDNWHQEMHCKYSKSTIKKSYGVTSADATVPVGISFDFHVLTGNKVLLFEVG